MSNNVGKKVKTGDKFGIKGWWVNKDLSDPDPIIWIDDIDDEVPSQIKRYHYFYVGNTEKKPTPDEAKKIIEKFD